MKKDNQVLIATRRDNVLTHVDGQVQKFEFTNQAKRASHELQLKNGGLGMGSVRLKS